MGPAELAQQVLEQLQAIRLLLEDLRTIGKDLVTTSRFQRGGYDGPFLRSQLFRLPAGNPVEIHSGGSLDRYGGPRALVIECSGTGHVGDVLYIGDDRAGLPRSFRVAIHNPVSIATSNPVRLMADRNQRLYALAVLNSPAPGEEPRLLVHEGKL